MRAVRRGGRWPARNVSGGENNVPNPMVHPLPLLANLAYSFRESNLAGKVIVLLLFIGSIYVWSVMVTKSMPRSMHTS